MSSVVAPAWCQCHTSKSRPTFEPHSRANASISGMRQMNSYGSARRRCRGPRNSSPRRTCERASTSAQARKRFRYSARNSALGVLLEGMIQVIMRGQPMAAEKDAASGSFSRSLRKASSSLRNSVGRLTAAGLIFRSSRRLLVAGRPAFMAAERSTSTPGKPTFAAKRANSGQATRPSTMVGLRERYTIHCGGKVGRLARACALRTRWLVVGGWWLVMVRNGAVGAVGVVCGLERTNPRALITGGLIARTPRSRQMPTGREGGEQFREIGEQ